MSWLCMPHPAQGRVHAGSTVWFYVSHCLFSFHIVFALKHACKEPPFMKVMLMRIFVRQQCRGVVAPTAEMAMAARSGMGAAPRVKRSSCVRLLLACGSVAGVTNRPQYPRYQSRHHSAVVALPSRQLVAVIPCQAF